MSNCSCAQSIFLAGFCQPEVLSKDPIVWLDRNRPTHPPSQGTCLHSQAAYPPQKYTCKYNKLAKKGKSTL